MATSQADIELNQRLMQLAGTLANGDTRIRNSLDNLIDVRTSEIETYQDMIDSRRDWINDEDKQMRARLVRLRQIELRHSELQKHYDDEKRRLAAERLVLEKEELSDKAKKDANLAKLIRQQIQNKDSEIQMVEKRWKAEQQMLDKIQNERLNLESTELRATAAWSSRMRNTLGDAVKNLIGKVFDANNFRLAIEGGIKAVSSGAATGGYGISLNPFSDTPGIMAAASFGMNSEEFIKVQAEYRRSILAARSGLDDFVGGMKEVRSSMRDVLVEPADQAKYAAGQFDIMTKAGIRAVATDAARSEQWMRQFIKNTGQVPGQFNAAISEIVNDEGVLAKLRSQTTEQERRATIMGIQRQLALNTAMGMTTEQAKAAAKELNKLGGQKPLERFKQAARIRAFGAAMGMGGEADQAARILTLGQRATPEQQAQLQKIMGSMSEALTQTGTGSFGAEIFATQLADKLQLTTLLGPSSPFNTTLAKAVEPLQSSADSMAKLPPILSEAVSWMKQIQQSVMKNELITGGAGLLAGVFGGKMITSLGGRLLGGVGSAAGGLGGAASRLIGPSRMASLASAGGKILGTVGRVGTGLAGLGTVANIGEGVYNIAEGNKEEGWGELAGTALGGLLGGIGGAFFGGAGAVPGALLGSSLGGQAGKWVGSLFADDEEEAQAKATSALTTEAMNTTSGIQQQIKQMDDTNSLLTRLAENSERQIALQEKQMELTGSVGSEIAITASRSSSNRTSNFRTRYGYVN